MKRVFSLLLALVMVFGMIPGVSAANTPSLPLGIEEYPALELATDLVITCSDNNYTYVTFTPETSGTYVFYSKSTDDTIASLYNSVMEELTRSDDCWAHDFHSERSFCITYDLEAGQTYVLGVDTYSGDTAEITIHVDRNHNYEYPALELETDLVITCSDNNYTYVTFTPETSGTYVFYSKSTDDTIASLYNSDMKKLAYSDDCWAHSFHSRRSFCITYDLEAGQPYVLGVCSYSGDTAEMTIRVDRNHNYEIADTREPTCTEEGAIIWVCADCGYSYTEILPIQHTYVETITKEPTCTEEGELTFTCTICGDSYTEVIPAIYEYWVDEDHVEIIDYTGDATELVIPAEIDGLPVTAIWEYAFWGCDSLTEVTIPDTVRTLGDDSFSGCDALRRVTIGKRVSEIGCAAFYGCKNLTEIIFRGTAPHFLTTTDGTAWYTFYEVTATAYYPANDGTWTNWKRQNYDGNITWVPYCPDSAHKYTAVVTAPTCTEQGYTTYTCACGHSYVDDYVDALGHDYKGGVCTRCGVEDPDYYNPFTDVPAGCWFEKPVLWALENGVTSGSSNTTFSPGNQCLRAHVVTFLWNAEKCPEPAATSSTFSDVPAGAWYEKPVLWAVENGITSGVSPTKFGAGDVCSRYQVVFFLWKAAGSPEPKTTVNPFTDVNPGHFFYKAVLWAVENGITSGTSDTTFSPTQPCNRAQVVTFLYAAYN